MLPLRVPPLNHPKFKNYSPIFALSVQNSYLCYITNKSSLMGAYINIGNEGFRITRNSEYVDKSGLISKINATLDTERCFTCVSRCRRFGKSMAAKMLAAYYDRSCDSRELFADLEIAKDPDFEKHLNKYPVIYLDMTDFTERYKGDANIVSHIQQALENDIIPLFPEEEFQPTDDLMNKLTRICQNRKEKFILIIDEWDAICREFSPESSAMDTYVGWLRRMFKSRSAADVFAGVYMTGILPIKKYKTESALNNFTEYSMVDPGGLAGYFGFTKQEVKALCLKHHMDMEEMEKWYDGYSIGDEPSMFNPNSVMQAIYKKRCQSYWASTGAYDAVATYIQSNYEGLKDDIISMLGCERRFVDPTGFRNDISEIHSKDDVLTVLIHLGYLGYDCRESQCYIPNFEVEGEMTNAVKDTNWRYVADALKASRQLIHDTLNGKADAVARALETIHQENTSILQYNDENSLSCALSIAYYTAKNDFVMHRELATGKGFADLVLLPRKNVSKPALVIELKYNLSADTAIDQILRKEYPAKVSEYTGDILLVGITYDKQTKQHSCQIERVSKCFSLD